MFLSLVGCCVAVKEGMPIRFILGHLVCTLSLIALAGVETVI